MKNALNAPANASGNAPESARAPETRTKVEQPHAHFKQPAEVVVDPLLSKDEKVHALEAMEQYARQLATASAEGMGGGEDARLHEVLVAKDALDLPPSDLAFAVVMQSLRAKLPEAEGTEAHAPIIRAIEAVEAASAAIARMVQAPATALGDPKS
ncbi:hypothetical protein [Limobrevibacterium gyesilva]|uniref:Uncharacterized protein n=1 Tax=Limobrevibacterium gyesilva TaxID=2991712 RepID=A0AA41YSY5_9PROT|nr:hypothetical protein [Limobrevibacterium gyesilva]MCW3474882.1 hypothetical protein [Limobrevibacterium gyesilva]